MDSALFVYFGQKIGCVKVAGFFAGSTGICRNSDKKLSQVRQPFVMPVIIILLQL